MNPSNSSFLALSISISISAAHAAEPLTIEHQGLTREYLEHRSSAPATAPQPLLIYLHGVRPPNWKNHTEPTIDALADREAVIVVYPKAVRERWNYAAVMGSPPAMAGNKMADDIAFISKLIDLYTSTKGADAKRVYVMGDSRGGLMTFSLMCRLAGKIAAAAPMITGMTDIQIKSCKPSRAVPLMVVAGSKDPVQPYDGWLYPESGYRLLSVAETMEFWRVQHGCKGQTAALIPHRVQEDATKLWKIDWTDCKLEGAVTLFGVDGGGHQVPGLVVHPDSEWLRQGGPQNHDIETIEEFWTFAKTFSRP